MSETSIDKVQTCVSFILEQIQKRNLHLRDQGSTPFFLGINGVQGIGKTLLVRAIAGALEKAPHHLNTVVLSVDDFYLSHEDQLRLTAVHPDNPLVHHRGQPSTHDLDLAASVLSSLRARHETRIPSYDKSAFNGQGDRVPQDKWSNVNADGQLPVDVVIFEGWCVGFRALDDAHLTACWSKAVRARHENDGYRGRLGYNRLEDVRFVNEALKAYDVLTNQLDALIHLDAGDPQYVYEWRLEQEAGLRRDRGSGMTDEEVVSFVDGCRSALVWLLGIKMLTGADYPSYELFTEGLRAGTFGSGSGKQLRLVIGKNRGVKEVVKV